MMSPGYYHLPAVWRHGIFLHAATNTIFYRSTDSVDLQPLRQQVDVTVQLADDWLRTATM